MVDFVYNVVSSNNFFTEDVWIEKKKLKNVSGLPRWFKLIMTILTVLPTLTITSFIYLCLSTSMDI